MTVIRHVGGSGRSAQAAPSSNPALRPFAPIADAISFLLSGILLGLIRAPSPPVDAPPAGPPIRGLARDVAAGKRYVFGQPHLRAVALTTTTANFFRSGLTAVLLVYLVTEAGASAGMIGAAFGLGNVGFVGAAIVAPRVARHFGIGPTIFAAVAVFGRLRCWWRWCHRAPRCTRRRR